MEEVPRLVSRQASDHCPPGVEVLRIMSLNVERRDLKTLEEVRGHHGRGHNGPSATH